MPGATFLSGDLVTLKTIEEADLPFVRDGVNHPAVRKAVGQTKPTTEADEAERLEAVNGARDSLQLLITSHDDPVGVITLGKIDGSNGVAEVEYWIDPEHRRQGYARDALHAVLDYAFDELRLHKVEARVFEFNVASLELLRNAGFDEEGVHREDAFVDGHYVDSHWFGLLESEWRDR